MSSSSVATLEKELREIKVTVNSILQILLEEDQFDSQGIYNGS